MDPNQRMQNAVDSMLSQMDKKQLRPLRKESFLCSAKCCDTDTGAEQLQHCVNNCQRKVMAAEEMISQELQMFQQKLQRCAMTCNDQVQDKIPSDPAKQTPDLLAKLEQEARVCANKCVDTHLAGLNKLSERVSGALKQMK